MAPGSDEDSDKSGAESSRYDGLSSFVASVLGQLAISSWLPAAFLVISLVALTAFRIQGSLSVPRALEALRGTDNQIMFLIWAIPVLVVGTMLTQAFTFEAIRVLEGYWWLGGPIGSVRRWKTRRQLGRKRAARERRLELSAQISVASRSRWIAHGTSMAVIEGLELVALGESIERLPEDVQSKVMRRKWWSHCDPSDVALVEDLQRREDEFPPRDARTLPTKLGNVLRATEDRLRNAQGNMEGFALKNRALVSARIQQQHDQFRARLDMYSGLTFVALFLSIVYPATLLTPPVPEPVELALVTLGFAVLSGTSYLASIAAARGYCVVLRQMDEAVQQALSLAPGSTDT